MAFGFDSNWVAAPPDVAGAGQDEWSQMTGIPATHPLVGGPGYGNLGAGMEADAGFARIVEGPSAAMPGGAPADPALRGRWNDWRELFDPHSPMLWLLLLAAGSMSLIHLRLEGRVASARAGAGIG
jgi:hypothetical protein